MNKFRDFVKNHGVSFMALVSAIVIGIANSSPSASFFIWEYEEEMPECLRDS